MTAISILCLTGNSPNRLFTNSGTVTVTREVEQDGTIVEVTEEVVIHNSIFGSRREVSRVVVPAPMNVRHDQGLSLPEPVKYIQYLETNPNQKDTQNP